ncbi:nitrate/nitrite transporter NrtS [Alphaproteobacteria bacterium LSUCC0719]
MFDLKYVASVFFSRNVAKRSFIVAVIVGTILAFINHGEVIVSGNLTATCWIKMIATCLVPYTVSSVTSVLGALEKRNATLQETGAA